MHPAAKPLMERIATTVRAAPLAQPIRIPGNGQPWTVEDLWLLADDENSYELVRGDLLMMTPASTIHGRYAMRLGASLSIYAEEHNLGEVYSAEAAFELQPPPQRVVRAPDVAFVSKARILPPEQEEGFWPIAPDLVIEIVSPSESQKEIREKIRDYFAAGTRLMWLVYPDEQLVEELRSPTALRQLVVDDNLEGGEVIPGFSYSLRQLFR